MAEPWDEGKESMKMTEESHLGTRVDSDFQQRGNARGSDFCRKITSVLGKQVHKALRFLEA